MHGGRLPRPSRDFSLASLRAVSLLPVLHSLPWFRSSRPLVDRRGPQEPGRHRGAVGEDTHLQLPAEAGHRPPHRFHHPPADGDARRRPRGDERDPHHALPGQFIGVSAKTRGYARTPRRFPAPPDPRSTPPAVAPAGRSATAGASPRAIPAAGIASDHADAMLTVARHAGQTLRPRCGGCVPTAAETPRPFLSSGMRRASAGADELGAAGRNLGRGRHGDGADVDAHRASVPRRPVDDWRDHPL